MLIEATERPCASMMEVPTPPTSWRNPPRLTAKPRARTRSSSAASRSRLGIEAAVGRGSGFGSSARTRSNGSSASCESPPETVWAGARWPIVPTERTGFDEGTCST